MTRTKPTIKAAKGYCKARYGRLPRCGREMEIIRYTDRLPLIVDECYRNGVRVFDCEVRVFLQNTSGSYRVVEYSH